VLYITLLDQFHPGIYSSQVIDVCDHLNRNYKADIRLVAFLSLKELLKTDARKRLKALSPDAIVLPAFPKLRYFELTAVLLFFVCLFTGRRKAICRNVFCTKMALHLKRFGVLKKVVLDGRSAMAAEIREYDVFPVDYLRKNVSRFEKEAVLKADFRMAVSEALVNYWSEEYGYQGNEHVIIPCTLDSKYFSAYTEFSSEEVIRVRKELQVSEQDVLLAYAGSTAPWQSFALMESFLVPLMEKDLRVKVVFLSKETDDIKRLVKRFPGRVIQKWVEHKEVLHYLSSADYGLLLREASVTNKVASPTKFAEYLYAGLKVLITEQLGDFSEFVKAQQCGVVIKMGVENDLMLSQRLPEERSHNRNLAMLHFQKENAYVSNEYLKLIKYFREEV
jgi:hypothetical protein